MKKGWEIKKLGELVNIKTGKLDSNAMVDGGKYPFFTCSREIFAINDYAFDCEAILLAGNNASGDFNVKHYNGKFNAYQRTYVITVNEGNKILYGYLYQQLTNHLKKFKEQSVGANTKFLKIGMIQGMVIPLPPIPEQQRIVSILDEAFAAIAVVKTNAEQNLKNAKELFESYLQGVFEKKGEGWEEKTLKEITTKIGSGATPRGGNESYKTEGISLVRSMNVHDFEFRPKNLAFIDDQQAKELNNVTLQENDVLLNITGASVARCCVIPKKYLPARVNQHVSIIRAKKEVIDSSFLNLILTSKFYKDQLLFTGEQGATRQAITKVQLELFKIAYPKSLKDQQTIVQKLDALSAETKRLEAIYQQKILDLEELKKSVLQKAFGGEL